MGLIREPLDDAQSRARQRDRCAHGARRSRLRPGPLRRNRAARLVVPRCCFDAPAVVRAGDRLHRGTGIPCAIASATMQHPLQRNGPQRPGEWSTLWRDAGNNCFARGALSIGKDSAGLFAIYHPSAAGWHRSLEQMTISLARSSTHP